VIASPRRLRFDGPCPRDPYVHDKYTREVTTARAVAREYFERLPTTIQQPWLFV